MSKRECDIGEASEREHSDVNNMVIVLGFEISGKEISRPFQRLYTFSSCFTLKSSIITLPLASHFLK
jgi:hypothetical protein